MPTRSRKREQLSGSREPEKESTLQPEKPSKQSLTPTPRQAPKLAMPNSRTGQATSGKVFTSPHSSVVVQNNSVVLIPTLGTVPQEAPITNESDMTDHPAADQFTIGDSIGFPSSPEPAPESAPPSPIVRRIMSDLPLDFAPFSPAQGTTPSPRSSTPPSPLAPPSAPWRAVSFSNPVTQRKHKNKLGRNRRNRRPSMYSIACKKSWRLYLLKRLGGKLKQIRTAAAARNAAERREEIRARARLRSKKSVPAYLDLEYDRAMDNLNAAARQFSVMVGGVSSIGEEVLRKFFGVCGPIRSCEKLGRDGDALITFKDKKALYNVLACDGFWLDGRRLDVRKAQAVADERETSTANEPVQNDPMTSINGVAFPTKFFFDNLTSSSSQPNELRISSNCRF